jgi:hypothetical protein
VTVGLAVGPPTLPMSGRAYFFGGSWFICSVSFCSSTIFSCCLEP